MGCHYRFHCVNCGYEAVVSGGDDSGMDCTTTTSSARTAVPCTTSRRLIRRKTHR